MADFAFEYTSGGAGWENLLTVLQGLGYEGGGPADFITIEEPDGNALRLKLGHDSSTTEPASSSDGIPVSATAATYRHVDMVMAWVYTPGADRYFISGHSDIDF